MKNIKLKLAAIFIIALSLRLFAVFTMPEKDKVLRHDDHRYEQIALSILKGEGFSKDGVPIAWRGPLYPYFVASVYKVFGENPDALRLVQCILGSLLCLVVYAIAASIFSQAAGIISAFFIAVYQPFIYYQYWGGPGFLYTETLYILLLAVAVWGLAIYAKKQSVRNMVFCGAALCLAALTKPTILAFFPLLLLWIIYLKRPLIFKACRDFFIICAVFFMVALPWTIRNYVVFKEFIFISNESGDVFIKGNHPSARGGVVWVDSELEKDPEALKKYSESYIKNAKYKEGLKFLLADPKRIPYLMFKKFIVNWNFFGEDGGYNLFYGIALLFGVAGIVFASRHIGPERLLLFYMLLWPTIIALVFFGEPRYRYPAEPYLVIFASFGIKSLWERRSIPLCRVLLWSGAVFNLAFYIYARPILGFLKAIIP